MSNNSYNILVMHTGHESYDKGLVKLHAFVPNQTMCQGQGLPVGLASKIPDRCLVSVHAGRSVQAIKELPEAQGGGWTQRTLQAKEGLVLQLFGSRRARWNSLLSSSNAYIRMRSSAALRKLTIPTLQIPGHSELHEVTVEGRFDVLSLAEAEALGAIPNPLYRAAFAPEKFSYLFRETIIEGPIASREVLVATTVINAEGEAEAATVTRSTALIEI